MMIRLTLLCVCCLLLRISPGFVRGQAEKDGTINPRQSVEEKLLALTLQEQELLEKNNYGPNHPQVRLIRKQIETARSFLLARQEGQPEEKRKGPQAEADRSGRENQAQRQEIERRVAEFKRRIAELREANKLDEAAEVEREARALILKLQGEPVRNKLDALRREIEELRKAGRNEEAAKLELQLRNAPESERRGRPSAEEREYQPRDAEGRRERAVREADRRQQGGPEDIERRLNHLRQAAENLMAAGLPEQAEQLRRQADMMRDTMRARSGEQPDRRPELQELHNQIRQQNERIERLEQLVRKLVEHIERQGAASNRGSEDKRSDDEKKE